ncbi:IS66 family insertion sequence element accessory protein TnpB [Mameliella alba]|uniref:IS66 family insertion sequence element accessory protein TnpB n=1 Tax=Mameliella alba TaxID=561184 RepID=UPI0015558759|nr:IS66 family insertion sequence element accessory protein TnpB [Mameliella alba]
MAEAVEPVDFRKGHDGLAALVQSTLAEDPFRDGLCLQGEARGPDEDPVAGKAAAS